MAPDEVQVAIFYMMLLCTLSDFWHFALKLFAEKRLGECYKSIVINSIGYGALSFVVSCIVGLLGVSLPVVSDMNLKTQFVSVILEEYNGFFYIICSFVVVTTIISYFGRKTRVINRTFRAFLSDSVKKIPSAILVAFIITILYFALTVALLCFATVRVVALDGLVLSYLTSVCVLIYYVLYEIEKEEEKDVVREDFQKVLSDNVIKRLFG